MQPTDSVLGSVTVRIRNIAVGGAGVGEVVSQSNGGQDLVGISAFIPYTARGELVEASVVKRKDRYLHADLLHVDEPSPERIEPNCKYFGQCGGCELQHLSQNEQIAAKTAMMLGALTAAGLEAVATAKIKPMVTRDHFRYRRRVTLHVDQSGKVGFFRSLTRSVVAVDDCLIAQENIAGAIPGLHQIATTLAGKIGSITLESDPDGVVAVMRTSGSLATHEVESILAAARGVFASCSVMVGDKEVAGYGRSILTLALEGPGGPVLRIPVGGFSQVNWEINRLLIERVVNIAQKIDPKEAYDFYAGAGNFAIPLARYGFNVTAIENDKRATGYGIETTKISGLQKRIEWVTASVESFLKKRPPAKSLIIADPPRNGLGHVISNLPKADKLILISCHLPSFVRDCKNLVANGWTLESIEPFDMFPQTSYVEILSVYAS